MAKGLPSQKDNSRLPLTATANHSGRTSAANSWPDNILFTWLLSWPIGAQMGSIDETKLQVYRMTAFLWITGRDFWRVMGLKKSPFLRVNHPRKSIGFGAVIWKVNRLRNGCETEPKRNDLSLGGVSEWVSGTTEKWSEEEEVIRLSSLFLQTIIGFKYDSHNA